MKIKWNFNNNNAIPTKTFKWGDLIIDSQNKVVYNYEDKYKKCIAKRKFKNRSQALNVMNTVIFRSDIHFRGENEKWDENVLIGTAWESEVIYNNEDKKEQ